ncbi:MAG: hypothetical protein JKY22_05840 [Flavobacteriaceae bacterium]|nr:hypothetical protein [Flavobacteriaceae bacterium]
MKNKNTVTSTEAATKAAGVTQLTPNQLVNMWDNLFYQVVSKKSDAVREAIIQMLVADNFLKKDDSGTTQSLITDDVDLQRLANAYVVIPQNVATNHLPQYSAQRNATTKDYQYLDKGLSAFEARIKEEAYNTAIDEVRNAIQINESENMTAYTLADETHLASVDQAYANATLSVDDATGVESYTNLNLPTFSFEESNIFKHGFLDIKVPSSTLTLVNNLTAKGVDNETQLVERLEEEAGDLASILHNDLDNKEKIVLYNGSFIRVSKKSVPEFTFSASAEASLKDSSKMVLALNLASGYESAEISANTLEITFDEGTIENNVTLNAESATTHTVLLTSYPDFISVPTTATSFNLAGILTLNNGVELIVDSDITLGGTRTHGGATRKLAQEKTIEHHGIKKMGVGDFRKVDQEVCCYVPGEVSRIENIMAKEYKERATRQLLSSETTNETTTEKEVDNLTDTTTSERNELSSEVASILNSDKSENYGASAGVNGTFDVFNGSLSFGVDAFHNGASSSSSSNSNSTSQTYAEEVTVRALERVVQKVTKKRTSRILREFEENNKHGFDNREGTSHVTGVYRWVDKIYTNKLINYGKRLMYEFNVPEPSKFFKEAIIEFIEGGEQTQIESIPTGLVLPDKPSTLPWHIKDARHISGQNYQKFAGWYNAEVVAPPTWNIKIAKSFSGGEYPESGGSRQFSFNNLEIPEGYRATKLNWSFEFKPGVNKKTDAKLLIAKKEIAIKRLTNGTPGNLANPSSGVVYIPSHSNGSNIPISIVAWDMGSFILNVTVNCYATNGNIMNWKNETYNIIVSAYQEQVNEYNDSLYANFVPDLPDTENQTNRLQFNPLLNRSLEKRELKRLAIQMMAKPFKIAISKDNYTSGSFTNINMTSAFEKHAQYIKFFEQCFDWEIMAYTFYSYFYADINKWKDLFRQSNGTDHIFQAFLQSSMARMVVPVRPGFEESVTYFLETGDIWMGNQLAIDRDDDLYLSIAEELQNTEGVVEKEWETRVPTALTILQADSAPLTENGLPCCHNETETENLAYGTSIMVGKDETTPTP